MATFWPPAITHTGLANDASVGDTLLIDDDKVAVRATAVDNVKVATEVTVPGAVSNNKGSLPAPVAPRTGPSRRT